MLSFPVDDRVFPQSHQQLQLLGKNFIVGIQVLSEQRERFNKRAPTGNDFGPTAAELVDGGKLLVHPNRIFTAQHGHGTAQPDVPGARGDGGQQG